MSLPLDTGYRPECVCVACKAARKAARTKAPPKAYAYRCGDKSCTLCAAGLAHVEEKP